MKDDIIKRQHENKMKLESKVTDLEKILSSLIVRIILLIFLYLEYAEIT
jgi:hypothetical protein